MPQINKYQGFEIHLGVSGGEDITLKSAQTKYLALYVSRGKEMVCLKGLFAGLTGVTLGCATTAGLALITEPASAQAAYGSYVGAGATFGITDGPQDNGRQIGGVLAVRYKLLELPISLRAQALIGSGTAVVPTISYDFPLNWQTDAYLGVGAAFASGSSPSPVGDKTSFALQPGVDYVVPNSSTVLFGNAIIAFDAYRNGGGTAFSVQGGVGLRF